MRNGRGLFARVGGGDDGADGFLIKAFEAAVALEVFQVAADGAFADKLVALFARDESGRQQAPGAGGVHGPALALGEGLAQKFEIGKRFHEVDALLL